jgi:hypothetical protein
VMGLGEFSFVWVYVAAPLIGGTVAGVLFRALDLGNDKPTTATPAEQALLDPAAEPGR